MRERVRWSVAAGLVLAAAQVTAQPVRLTPEDNGRDPDADAVILPDITVTPPPDDLDMRRARDRMRLERSLPTLGTDRPRTKDFSETLLEGLGLRGVDMEELSPADRDRYAEMMDKLENGIR